MSGLDTQLRTFIEIARLGSLRRAAEELNVTQAAVTARIKTLEDWLGFQVLRRHRRGAELTEAGERFIDYARTAVTAVEQGREDGRRVRSYRAHYRFMSQFLLLESFALDWVAWMRAEAADISLSIDSAYAGYAAKRIAAGLLDLAVGYQTDNVAGVEFEPLFTERLVLATSCPPEVDWRQHYIRIEWDDAFSRAHRHHFGRLGRECAIRAEFADAARRLMARQPASAYVVERAVRPALGQGRLSLVPDAPAFERSAFAIFPASPIDPEIQEMALAGMRKLAGAIELR